MMRTTMAAAHQTVAARLWARLTVPRDALLTGLVVAGVVLRAWQYLADTSLWFDELSVARNISERSLAELVRVPLAYQQVAPVGFIALTKVSTLLFGASDMALRLVPFLCGIIALFLFRRLAERTLDGVAVPVAVALFALGIPFIRYTAELKQYGLDVAVTLALTLQAVDLRARPPTARRCLVAGVTGLALVWFSQTAVFVMAGLGVALALGWLVDRAPSVRGPVAITVPIWALASVAGLLVSRHYANADTLVFMHRFWQIQHGFMPLPLNSAHVLAWCWDRIVQFFGSPWMLQYPWPMLYAVLAILGFGAVWRRRRDIALILAGPYAVTLLAAVAQQYPFRERVVLFLLPSLLLMVAAAVEWIRKRTAAVRPALGAMTTAAFLAPPVWALAVMPPPYVVEAFKPVLAYVQVHRRPTDAIYVYAHAFEAVDHYGSRFGLPLGTYVVGICDDRDFRPYLADVDRFRGASRVWLISSSVRSLLPPLRAIDRYLQTIGVRRDSIVIPSLMGLGPVSAELFDLSDATRLQLATASTFPVDAIADTLRPNCRDFVRPTPAAR